MPADRPCECASEAEALNKNCLRAGMLMRGRLWELCSGKCPAERPCPENLSVRKRRQWDSTVWFQHPPRDGEVRAAVEGDGMNKALTQATAFLPLPARTIPYADWPAAVKAVALLRRPEDVGVGDTIARNLKRLGADALTKLYTLFTGQECGCGDRQARLNRIYKYPR